MENLSAASAKLERYEQQEFGTNSFFVGRDNFRHIMSD